MAGIRNLSLLGPIFLLFSAGDCPKTTHNKKLTGEIYVDANVFVDKDFTRLKEKVSFNLSAIDHGDTMKIARSSGVFIVLASSTLSIMIEGDGIRAVVEKFASRAGHLRIADL